MQQQLQQQSLRHFVRSSLWANATAATAAAHHQQQQQHELRCHCRHDLHT